MTQYLWSWMIGLIIIAGAVIWVGYRMAAEACPAPTAVEFIVLAVVPAVYLVLMYLTLKRP